MASWFSFSCAKPRNERSSLLEENLAAKAETQPSCVRCQSDESSVSDANASLLSEASTAPGIRDGSPPKRRTSFADQQQQPLEKMCASTPPSKSLQPPYLQSGCTAHPPLALRADFTSLRATMSRSRWATETMTTTTMVTTLR